MYLHLGQETVIRTDEIIGIFDIETTSVAKDTRSFLKYAEERLQVTAVSDELPKSFILCWDDSGMRVYLSQISTATLKRRCGFVEALAEG